jgi:hypothetical protein
MFDPQSDPLGLALMARARARRQAQQAVNPAAQAYASGPLPNENWDAFFQAVEEANPGKAVKFAGGTAPGSNQLVGFQPNALMGAGSHGENMVENADPFSKLAVLSKLRRQSKTGGVS